MFDAIKKRTSKDVDVANEEVSAEVVEIPAEAEREKPYEFRVLCAKDIPLITNVIKSIGISEFKECFKGDTIKDIVGMFTGKATEEADNENEQNEVADSQNEDADNENTLIAVGVSLLPSLMDVADVILNNIDKCEAALIKLFASTSNLTAEQIGELSIADFAEMVLDFIQKEEFPDFFKVVSKRFK